MSSAPLSAQVRLVCLDLGGVLIRICRNWGEACEAAKVRLPPHFAARAAAEILPALHDLSREHESGRLDEAGFVRAASDLTGLAPPDVVAAIEGWLHAPYAGAAELVTRLATHPSVKSACLTNTTPRHWRMLTTPGGRFDVGLDRLAWRFTSFEIGEMKPSPEIYGHVERTTGIAPASILFFDDNPNNAAAARACGWQAEVIDPAGDPPAQIIGHLARRGVTL